MPRSRKTWDENSYVAGHTRQFKETLRFCDGVPLGNPGDACQVYKAEAIRSGQVYAVKLFKPYSNEQMARDRSRLRRKGLEVSDKALENYFHPWHRESRAYEQIDRKVPQPKRQFFPEYYGTALISLSSVPAHWTRTMPPEDQVPIIVLEYFGGLRTVNGDFNLQISQESLNKARSLHAQFDHEFVHVYAHVMEVLETLHAADVIHGDLKSDAFTSCVDTGKLIMFDFSLSWVSKNRMPCLDSFRKSPMTFSHQSQSERRDVEHIISTEYDTLQKMIPFSASCRNCVDAMKQICGGIHASEDNYA